LNWIENDHCEVETKHQTLALLAEDREKLLYINYNMFLFHWLPVMPLGACFWRDSKRFVAQPHLRRHVPLLFWFGTMQLVLFSGLCLPPKTIQSISYPVIISSARVVSDHCSVLTRRCATTIFPKEIWLHILHFFPPFLQSTPVWLNTPKNKNKINACLNILAAIVINHSAWKQNKLGRLNKKQELPANMLLSLALLPTFCSL
jgi:hypothetical protein